MRIIVSSATASLVATAALGACSWTVGSTVDKVTVEPTDEQLLAERKITTRSGPVPAFTYEVNEDDGRTTKLVSTDPDAPRCEFARPVERPKWREVRLTDTGDRMRPKDYHRSVFYECIEPGKVVQ